MLQNYEKKIRGKKQNFNGTVYYMGKTRGFNFDCIWQKVEKQDQQTFLATKFCRQIVRD